MSIRSQLLCTFTTVENLDSTIQQIIDTYTIVFDTIYVLENVDMPGSLCCTYNIDADAELKQQIPEATISLHRKKASNSLYSINAINLLIMELNHGQLDKSFKIPWENYKNTILVTAYNKLKKINTKLNKIVKVSEIA